MTELFDLDVEMEPQVDHEELHSGSSFMVTPLLAD